MPLVARRSPASEKAAIYGYGDLLRDSLALVGKKAAANVARMTSGGMGEEEILETALAPAGGMLKVAGTSKLLAGLLAKQARHFVEARKAGATEAYLKGAILPGYQKTGRVFKEALKVPEKEYGRIKDIGWSSMAGQQSGTKGFYDPMTKEIKLHSGLIDPETVWHEFTHARQYSPEWGSKLPGGGSERVASYDLRILLAALAKVAENTGMSRREFYKRISPTERHARGVASAAVKFPRDFSALYKYGLKNEIAISRKRLKEFWGE